MQMAGESNSQRIKREGVVKLLTIVLITLIILMAVLLSALNAEPVYLNNYFGKSAFPLLLLLVMALIRGLMLSVLSCLSMIFSVKRDNEG